MIVLDRFSAIGSLSSMMALGNGFDDLKLSIANHLCTQDDLWSQFKDQTLSSQEQIALVVDTVGKVRVLDCPGTHTEDSTPCYLLTSVDLIVFWGCSYSCRCTAFLECQGHEKGQIHLTHWQIYRPLSLLPNPQSNQICRPHGDYKSIGDLRNRPIGIYTVGLYMV